MVISIAPYRILFTGFFWGPLLDIHPGRNPRPNSEIESRSLHLRAWALQFRLLHIFLGVSLLLSYVAQLIPLSAELIARERQLLHRLFRFPGTLTVKDFMSWQTFGAPEVVSLEVFVVAALFRASYNQSRQQNSRDQS